MEVMKPGKTEKLLDVGVSPFIGRWENFLEIWYPYPENITALTIAQESECEAFCRAFPKVNLVFGDGKGMDFSDDAFDIVFSNAVVEHTGQREEQKKFVREVVRVGRRAYITTPCYWFPVDAHTLIPFAHYFPLSLRFWIYIKLGREYHADLNHLNLLKTKEFLGLFPKNVEVKLYKQRFCGLVSTLVAVIEKKKGF